MGLKTGKLKQIPRAGLPNRSNGMPPKTPSATGGGPSGGKGFARGGARLRARGGGRVGRPGRAPY